MRVPGHAFQLTARRLRERGTALTEFALVFLPTLGLLFLLANLSWIVFAWACVQEGVREGVRTAITCSPSTGLNAAVQSVVQHYSFGFINAQNAPSILTIQYYSQPTNTVVSGPITTGDIVKVSVSGLQLDVFASGFFNSSPIYIGATSADVMACSNPATP
jgi:Flp pilus assembly protein TadG